MELYQDFKEFLELLNKNKVDYVIVGGYALAFYGYPRYTGDIDIYIKPDLENSKKIIQTLNDFGFKSLNLVESDFTIPDNVIQLGVPPVRIDILTSLSGVKWEEVIQGAVSGSYGTVNVLFVGKKELVINKKAVGRHKDLADLEGINEL